MNGTYDLTYSFDEAFENFSGDKSDLRLTSKLSHTAMFLPVWFDKVAVKIANEWHFLSFHEQRLPQQTLNNRQMTWIGPK